MKARDAFFFQTEGIARYLALKFVRVGVEYDDLYQEGCVALLNVMRLYKIDSGFSFSTYAMAHLRGILTNYVKEQGLIKIQRQFYDATHRWWREKARLKAKLLHDPSDLQIAASLQMTARKTRSMVEHNRIVNQEISSIDRKIMFEHGEEEMSLADVLDAKEIPILHRLEKMEEVSQMNKLINQLKDKWQKVVVIKHGIDDDTPRTLDQTGRHLGISRERVRQIEERALAHLKKGIKKYQRGE